MAKRHMMVAVTSGMSGHYAVMYDTRTGEVETTGIGRYRSPFQAAAEAVDMANSESALLEDSVREILKKGGA